MGGKTTQATTSNTPWAPQGNALAESYLLARDNLAQEAAGNRGQYFQGLTYTPADWKTNEGTNALFNRGQQSAGYEQAVAGQAGALTSRGASALPGYGTLASTANGDMIGRNPEFQGMVDRAISAARPSIDSAFAASGRLGSGSHAAAFSDAATRMAGDLAYQNYTNERNQQLQAATTLGQSDLAARTLGGQLAGQAAGADYQNINAMLQAGNITEGYGDKALTDEINRHNYQQNATYDQLSRYMALIQGAGTVGGTMTQPVTGGSRLGNAASGALAGYSASGGNPYGAVVGGLLGAFQ
ncbi:hypothetical protein [Siccirubricoccus phaeus]|uniref:hypothetical protein n=1 Tax=Siccirubricoccus phaeus TaxID=2595053 RepID=UPI0011F162FF|nr:hypothetical protein [Siccirubricoccus phaeus]